MALQLGATYVARGFSGDKGQLVPLIEGAIRHGGAAFIDVISPCVAFNNHDGSTKSYDHVRDHNEAVNRVDFIDLAQPTIAEPGPDAVLELPQADGSRLRLRKLREDFDPTDRIGAMNRLQRHQARGETADRAALRRHPRRGHARGAEHLRAAAQHAGGGRAVPGRGDAGAPQRRLALSRPIAPSAISANTTRLQNS